MRTFAERRGVWWAMTVVAIVAACPPGGAAVADDRPAIGRPDTHAQSPCIVVPCPPPKPH
jgi:hypothetical protein